MNFKKTLLVFSILLNILIFKLNAQDSKNFNMFNIEFLKKELNLNENQAEKIKIISSDSLREFERKYINLERTILDLKEELLKNTADLSKIKNIIDKKAAISGEIELMSIKRDLLIKSILTIEQFMKWETLKKPIPQNPMVLPYHINNFSMEPKDKNQKYHPKKN